MASVQCPCGFAAETGDNYENLAEVMSAYKAHGCEHHPAVVEKSDWSGAVVSVVFTLAVAAVCIVCLIARG